MIHATHNTTAKGAAPRRGIGLSPLAVVVLAAVAAIRVPLHDLDLVREGSILAALLVFVPLAIWVAVALARRVPNPLLTLTVVGFAYAGMLAVTHQLLWGAAFGGNPPSLGGNLEGVLSPGAEAAVFRVSAFFSSLATGTAVGVVAGAVAWALRRLWQGA
ncbi:Hypothetical Protein RradSPS_2836 (plasmid) [Rubrobacter radiotolerans]|uniref:Uncharacterized protein n=1 Tax=Rubrobacter radiotolerans TaxID=42256 RepID=A0A023X7U0_RUBRA|nr:hypothetical protein [Rubrobacter radiotolerans]AHY48119.1 Hypothetical Protein RradSPS_2836 [Rubrobacter radiotolerans]MDX5895391.1 hypothetical protein [Rubrobacter radiotolerans]SMC01752.1 conserved hypothetical protein [Rubrobacter radiotolerans DSM 5868]